MTATASLRYLRRKLAAARRFVATETGAVTVDWTVLAAAAVGLGLGAVAAVRSGVVSLGGEVEASLSGASVAALSGPQWPGAGLTNGICPGRDALVASYNALVAGGETFADLIAGGAQGPFEQTWFGIWLAEAEASGFSADEFVGSWQMWQDGTGPGNDASREFMARFFACTLEASPTDWSQQPGGSLAGYLLWDFGFHLPAG